MKVYILSGYTGAGGSTNAFIMLTNALNDAGVETIFIGPHDYPTDKCKFTNNMSETLQLLTNEDILITHFLTINKRPPVKRLIFVSHETYWSELYNLPEFFDEVIFLHEQHREYHEEYLGEYSIIPNLKPNLISIPKEDKKLIAGIIGSIEDRKQTSVSISRALNDNCEKILLFGNINDQEYWDKSVIEWIHAFPEKIEHVGHIEDRQEMYDMIGRVYHSSKGEVACLVKDECYLTSTEFYGNEQTENEVSTLSNNEVVQLWIKLFNK